MFKVGDRVRYVRGPNQEQTNWAEKNGMIKNKIYTVNKASDEAVTVRPRENSKDYWVEEIQFNYAKLSNEERMAKRMEELCLK